MSSFELDGRVYTVQSDRKFFPDFGGERLVERMEEDWRYRRELESTRPLQPTDGFGGRDKLRMIFGSEVPLRDLHERSFYWRGVQEIARRYDEIYGDESYHGLPVDSAVTKVLVFKIRQEEERKQELLKRLFPSRRETRQDEVMERCSEQNAAIEARLDKVVERCSKQNTAIEAWQAKLRSRMGRLFGKKDSE